MCNTYIIMDIQIQLKPCFASSLPKKCAEFLPNFILALRIITIV